MDHTDALSWQIPDDLAEALIEHFDREPWEDHKVPQPNGQVLTQRLAASPPLLLEFAGRHGVRREDLHAWATAVDAEGRPRHPAFAKAYRQAQVVQAHRLREGCRDGWWVEAGVESLLRGCGWRPQPALGAAG